MSDKPSYIVWDLETSHNIPESPDTYILEIAATVVDFRSLEIIESFHSFVRPPISDEEILALNGPIRPDALKANHINRYDIIKFPDEKVVLPNFKDFCSKYRVGKNAHGNLVAVGHNIIKFDIPIIQRVFPKYKLGYPFNPRDVIDLMSLSYVLLHSLTGEHLIERYSADYLLREYFGIAKSDETGCAHSAVKDVSDFTRYFIRWMRWLRSKIKQQNSITPFKGCFSNE